MLPSDLVIFAFISIPYESGAMGPSSTERVSSNEVQFSLRSLLVVLGIACVLLAPAHWFGVPYLFSIGFSLVLVISCVLAYRKSIPVTFAIAIGGACVGFPIALALLVFFFHAVLNAIACIVVIPFSPRPRTLAIALAGVMVAIYGFLFWEGAAKMQEIRALQAQYPFASLSKRLAFEREPKSSSPITPTPIQLNAEVSSNLDAQDKLQDERGYYARAWSLRALHEDYQQEFIRAAGFGISRMPSLTYRLVNFELPVPLSLPSAVQVSKLPRSDKELQEVHRVAANDFVSPEGLGYVRSREEVAGFESHRFTSLNQSWHSESPTARYWQVARLELVGLLRDEPRVYTAKTLPPMDQISQAPHRELNRYEQGALPHLISEQDVVVDTHQERIQMLGALRAGNTCLECHEGQFGKLLGAFSYELLPLPPAEENVSTADISMSAR